ncbi:MAG: hypothetical protein H7282_17950 [Cytophagaceae bacterium]|nr:hypothetical protein [Cytophagaceae bacterium]
MSNLILPEDVFTDFASQNDKEWSGIVNAKEKTKSVIESIKIAITHDSIPLSLTDSDLVIFGSIARKECTEKSDIDWTLLIDAAGSSAPNNIAYSIGEQLERKDLIKPGSSGMFGQITYSHEIINFIGGQDDTNHNMTRRMLMLLESTKTNPNGIEDSFSAYERVCRAIIDQYIKHDSSYLAHRIGKKKFPRYLLNDVIRFWRTMCVDFAYKQKEQGGNKWALRNIKLRMSRKLIFIKGLLMCFECYQNKDLNEIETREKLEKAIEIPALDYVIKVFIENNISKADIIRFIDLYNEFINLLDNPVFREELKCLEMDKAYETPTFKDAKQNCDEFQKVFDKIFIYDQSEIQKFTLKYGIF